MLSRLGLILSSVYLAITAYLVATQGIFGESFIALILGLPWSALLALFEYFHAKGAVLYVLVLIPIMINAAILYWLGIKFRPFHPFGKAGAGGGPAH